MFLNFYGFLVRIKGDVAKTQELLTKDFAFFVSEPGKPALTISYSLVKEVESKIPKGLKALRQNARAITYEKGFTRYNYFYGKAVSVLDYQKNVMLIFSKEEDYLHELLYLAVLSRETKFHDLNGLHKLHAFGVAKNGMALLGMMNMKGGKTTLFSYFLDKKGIDLISDDTPLIDTLGRVRAFPVRIGYELNSYTEERLSSYEEKSYLFNREEYGPKRLISLLEFSNPVASQPIKKAILFQGIRVHGSEEARIEKIGKIKMFRHLVKNMVVGVGLPMVLEYYLEAGFRGKLKNLRVLIARAVAAFMLLMRSRCYEVYLCPVPAENYRALKTLLEEAK